jgi:hypothetical protein
METMEQRFFLGGQDLEMQEIRSLLRVHAPGRIEDGNLPWGARLSSYKSELLSALEAGQQPILIELQDDLPAELFDRDTCIVVDHHGPRAGRDQPTSIEQVWRILGLPDAGWPRHLALVAANDRAHVAGLVEAGATPDEILAIRAADRAAQGVTAADEAEALRAIADRRGQGRVVIVETVSTTSSAIADRMRTELGGPGYDRLLVVMPDKLAVFGDGEAIGGLAAAYPASWWGGDLPAAGFWGMPLSPADPGTATALIERLK